MMTMTRKLVSLGVTTVGVLGVAVSLTTLDSHQVTAAPTVSGPQNVLVVNPATQPVPISGSVGVTGSVSVANTVTAHLDSNEVIIDNTVPIVVQPDGAPFSFRAEVNLTANMGGSSLFYNTPPGKRVYIEHVSGRMVGGAAGEHLRAMVQIGPGLAGEPFQRYFPAPTLIDTDDRVYDSPLHATSPAQAIVALGVERDGGGTLVSAELQISGRLVDAP